MVASEEKKCVTTVLNNTSLDPISLADSKLWF